MTMQASKTQRCETPVPARAKSSLAEREQLIGGREIGKRELDEGLSIRVVDTWTFGRPRNDVLEESRRRKTEGLKSKRSSGNSKCRLSQDNTSPMRAIP